MNACGGMLFGVAEGDNYPSGLEHEQYKTSFGAAFLPKDLTTACATRKFWHLSRCVDAKWRVFEVSFGAEFRG